MNYIVFDLEWNQPDDGKSSAERELLFEIIEIGAVKLNEQFEITAEFHELIRPTVYKQINWRTRKMLQLKSHELDKGKPFPEVFQKFLRFCGKDYIFCIWGSQDITELQRNMTYFHITPLSDGPIAYYNLQKIFAIREDDPSIVRNLEAAVDLMKIEKEIPFHRAFSDAFYTARIMQRIGLEQMKTLYSYDLYHIPSSEKKEIRYFNEEELYYVSRGFAQRTDLTEDRKIMQFWCPKCNYRAVRPKVRWFNTNSRTYLGAAVCETHGAIRGRIRIRKDMQELTYAEKILTYVPMTEIKEIQEKKKAVKKHTPAKDNTAGKEKISQAAEKTAAGKHAGSPVAGKRVTEKHARSPVAGKRVTGKHARSPVTGKSVTGKDASGK